MLFSLRAAILRLRKKQTRCAVSIHRAMRDSIVLRIETATWRRGHHIVPLIYLQDRPRLSTGIGRYLSLLSDSVRPQTAQRFCNEPRERSRFRGPAWVGRRFASRCARRPDFRQ